MVVRIRCLPSERIKPIEIAITKVLDKEPRVANEFVRLGRTDTRGSVVISGKARMFERLEAELLRGLQEGGWNVSGSLVRTQGALESWLLAKGGEYAWLTMMVCGERRVAVLSNRMPRDDAPSANDSVLALDPGWESLVANFVRSFEEQRDSPANAPASAAAAEKDAA